MRVLLEKVDFLAPDRVTDDASILTLKALVLEPMLRWRDGRVAPGLFDRWAVAEGGRDWRLTLREGARWHDGAPVEAEEAAAFLRAILAARDTFGMPWSYVRYLAGAAIAAEGRTLRVVTPDPFPDLPDILSEFSLPRADARGRYTLGTGPWAVDEEGDGEAALRHPDGRRLRLAAVPSTEARHAALLAGEAEAANRLERLDPPRAARGDGLAWLSSPVALSVMAYLNGAAGPFADPRLRRAANLAVDRAALVADVMGGLGVPARTAVSPVHMGFAEAALPPIPHDPEAARALVAAAGGPRDVVLRTPLFMPDRAPAIAAFVARAWDGVGLRTRIETAADRPAYARALGAKDMGDAALFDSSPHSTFRVMDDKISARSRAVWWQGVEDPEADRLFEAARRTVPDAARAAAYGALLRRLHEAPPWLYLFHPVEVAAHAPGLAGLSLDPKGVLRIA